MSDKVKDQETLNSLDMQSTESALERANRELVNSLNSMSKKLEVLEKSLSLILAHPDESKQEVVLEKRESKNSTQLINHIYDLIDSSEVNNRELQSILERIQL
jgi:uncharacterized membrane-anchored protein YhcB (DUF1043 family)